MSWARHRHQKARARRRTRGVGRRAATGRQVDLAARNEARRDEPVLLLPAEEPRIRELGTSPALALDALRDVLQPSTILFIDEAQHLDDAPLWIKGLVDLEPRRRIVATGSSSFTLKAKTRESLAGRARRTLLLPLSLEEVAATLPAGLAPAVREAQLLELWQKLVLTGGYPEPWLASDPPTLLHQLVEAFVLRERPGPIPAPVGARRDPF